MCYILLVNVCNLPFVFCVCILCIQTSVKLFLWWSIQKNINPSPAAVILLFLSSILKHCHLPMIIDVSTQSRVLTAASDFQILILNDSYYCAIAFTKDNSDPTINPALVNCINLKWSEQGTLSKKTQLGC